MFSTSIHELIVTIQNATQPKDDKTSCLVCHKIRKTTIKLTPEFLQKRKEVIIMTKSDVSYASVPTATPSNEPPYVDGFAIGSSHAVTVIVDENRRTGCGNGDPYAPEHPSTYLKGTRKPVHLSKCPSCQQANIRTSTRTYPGAATWFGVVATAFCFLPLAWVPLVIDSCKQTDHYCQSCGKKIGTVKPLEGCFVKERS